jgi:hypothetical protein
VACSSSTRVISNTMRMSRHQQQRLTACTAILAVLLLFLAPVVSKSLMTHQGISTSSAAVVSVSTPEINDPAMEQMANMADMHHMPPAATPAFPGEQDHHSMTMGDDSACGYCELLIHVPLMLWLFVPLLWLIMLVARILRSPPVLSPLIQRWSFRQRPRGPPCPTFFFVS